VVISRVFTKLEINSCSFREMHIVVVSYIPRAKFNNCLALCCYQYKLDDLKMHNYNFDYVLKFDEISVD